MTRTAGAQIGCQRPSRFWGLGCPKIYHEAEDTLEDRLLTCLEPCCGSGVMLLSFARQIYADHGPGGLSRCGLYA
ncbi:hypothetical protein, partial [Thiolapillus sp.]